jgi:hypothetical protein
MTYEKPTFRQRVYEESDDMDRVVRCSSLTGVTEGLPVIQPLPAWGMPTLKAKAQQDGSKLIFYTSVDRDRPMEKIERRSFCKIRSTASADCGLIKHCKGLFLVVLTQIAPVASEMT